MKIRLCSIFVDDQTKALDFYTRVLGFEKRQEIPVGKYRWLTVGSTEGGDAEVSLEPNENPAAKTFQEALFKQGIPLTAFEVSDVQAEYKRLREASVEFTSPPKEAHGVWMAIFADTCGNLIQIYQPPAAA